MLNALGIVVVSPSKKSLPFRDEPWVLMKPEIRYMKKAMIQKKVDFIGETF